MGIKGKAFFVNAVGRPKKCLNFQTPYEVFEKLTGVDVRKIMGYALIT